MSESLDKYIARLKADLEGARAALGRETLRSERLQVERDNARADARLLAHAYFDAVPGVALQEVVKRALAYPAGPESARSSWAKPAPIIEKKR